MKLTFLGTGTSQGIPIVGSNHPVCLSENLKDKRLRTAALINWEDCYIAIDCGPDFRQQYLKHPVPHLNAILFTHEHADHTAGIDDIRPFFFKQGAIDVYGQQRLLDSLERRFDYIFCEHDKYPGAPSVKKHSVDTKPFKIGGKLIIPIKANHNLIEVLGYRIGDFAYFTDVKSFDETALEQLHGVKTLVLNALRIEPHHSHLSLEEAIEMAQKIGAKNTYFTHISHLLGFHDQVSKNLPKGIHLAYDNLTIEVL